MEVRRAQRAFASRGAPVGLHLRRHLQAAHDRQRRESRHGLVLDVGPRVAGEESGLRGMAQSRKLHDRWPPEDSAVPAAVLTIFPPFKIDSRAASMTCSL